MKVKNVLLMCVSHKEVRQKQEIIEACPRGDASYILIRTRC